MKRLRKLDNIRFKSRSGKKKLSSKRIFIGNKRKKLIEYITFGRKRVNTNKL